MKKMTIQYLLLCLLFIPIVLIGQSLNSEDFHPDVPFMLDKFNPALQGVYMPEGNLATRNYSDLYQLDSILSNDRISRFQYDKFNRNTEFTLSGLPENKRYLKQVKKYSGETNLLTSSLVDIYEEDGITIKAQTISTYSYNNNQLIDAIRLETGLDSFELTNIKAFAYNADGLVESLRTITHDENDNEVVTHRTEYTYDPVGRLTREENFVLSEELGAFELRSFTKFNHDSIPNTVVETLVPSNSIWKEVREYILDENQDIISERYRSTQMNQSIEIVAYDYNKELSSVSIDFPTITSPEPRFQDFYERPSQLVSATLTDISTDGTIGDTKVINYFWSKQNETTSIKNTIVANIDVYPNPVINNLTLEIDVSEKVLTLEVYDLMGRKQFVVDNVLSGNQQIDVSLLGTGMYFFTLQDEKQVLYSGKFIKE